MIKLHCCRGEVLSIEQEIVVKVVLGRFRSNIIYKNLIEKWIFGDSAEIKIKFLVTNDFLTFWNISSGLCTQIFYSQIRGDLK